MDTVTKNIEEIPPADINKSSQMSTVPPLLPPEINRESIINTAVKFLENPRVRCTSLEQKESFLRQKGLSQDEIKVACQRAGGAYAQDQQIVSSLPALPPRIPQLIERSSPKLPFWIKIRDIGNMIALLSMGSYSLYVLWKSHIGPWLFGSPTQRDQKHQVLLQAISNLNESVGELRTLVGRLETHLLNLPKGKSGSGRGRSKEIHALEDVKEELSSIKALLLSRTQFPSSPGIPSWQLVSIPKDGTSEGTSRDHSPHPAEEPIDKGGQDGLGRKDSRGTSSSSQDSVALHSDSSCEVVMIGGKQQDSDHSDE